MKKHTTDALFLNARRLTLLLLLSLSTCLSMQRLHGQVLTTYSFSGSSGTYTSVTGGTLLGASGNDDQVYIDPLIPTGVTTTVPTGPGLNIGFNFELNGVLYDRLGISTNGWLALGQSALTPSVDMTNSANIEYFYTGLDQAFSTQPDVLKNRILGFNVDMEMIAASSIRIETIGTAPSRVCVVQWQGMRKYTTGTTADNFNFQIRLNETSNTIEYVYGTVTADPANNPTQTGLLLNNGFISRTGTWAASTAGTTTTDAMTLTSTIKPATGLTYTWTPVPKTYAGSTVYTINGSPVSPGATDKELIMVNIEVSGVASTLDVTTIEVATTGTTSLADISNLKVYSTGQTPSFSASNQFGSTISTPAASNSVTGTTSLLPGNNFFWVTYDINSSAVIGNVVDAEITSVTVGGTAHTPSTTAPAGNRQIMAPVVPTMYTTGSSNYTANSATIGGVVGFDGGSNITATGMVFGTDPNPQIGDPGVIDSVTSPAVLSGAFSFDLSALTVNTKYYYRAYAINAVGVGYSATDSFNTDPIISSLPYNQDFETSGNTGWRSGIVGGATNDWELGTPNKWQFSAAHSGANAWVTGLNNPYNDYSNCAVESPRFDFSSATADPIVSFFLSFDSESYWDGLVLEMSIAGGAWTRLDPTAGIAPDYRTAKSFNWYNRDASMFNAPLGAPVWASNSSIYPSNVSGWVMSGTELTGAAGQSDVRIRFRFESDGSGTYDGFAIDDISVFMPTAPAVLSGTSHLVTTTFARVDGGIITNGFSEITASGIVIGVNPDPSIGDAGVIDSLTNPIVGIGPFSITTNGLTPGTVYHYRAYATNAVGTSYGADSTFTTLATAIAPSVYLSGPATDLSDSSATIRGYITSDGGDVVTASGILLGTSPNPAVGDPTVIDSATADASSTTFTVTFTTLTPATWYYFRSYAVNAAGTAYSEQDSFMTSPVISTLPYVQNFETGGVNTGWIPASTGGGNPWELGTPSKFYIDGAYSGSSAWVTRLTGNYGLGEDAAVVSPRFDFSALTIDPVLRFTHKFATVFSDGAIVEMSVNGGSWTPLDDAVGSGDGYETPLSNVWYNTYSNGWTALNNQFSGRSEYYQSQNSGWITSNTLLAGAAGASDVRIRMRFASTTVPWFGNDEGWAFDDIEVIEGTTATVLTGTNTNITSTNVRLFGEIPSTGLLPISASGIVVGTSPAPLRTDVGVIDSTTNPLIYSGAFELDIRGLSAGTTYYYRTYAENAAGTAYGPDSTFTTNATATVPTLRNNGSANIGYAFAEVAGAIITDGGDEITASGMVLGTSPDPQVGDPAVADSTTNPVALWGTGATKFSFEMHGLIPATKYYYRAYATNAVGTGYSVTDSFETDAPIITTGISENITMTRADLSARIRPIVGLGDNSTITASGILLSTTPNPVIGGIGVADSASSPFKNLGPFTIRFGGLNPGTTYYYTGYAITPYGTFYGPDSSFTTNTSVAAPTVKARTMQASFSETTAAIEINITSDGDDPVTASGILFGTTPNPTVGDPAVIDSVTTPYVLFGKYTIGLTDLTPSTTYYFRTYAINGVGIGYSTVDSFITDNFVISSFPYVQTFDRNDNAGWRASIVGGTNNDWEIGTPNKFQLNGAYSGDNAWVTRLNSDYNDYTNCAVTSPRFDFSALSTDPVFRFMQNFLSEAYWDAVVLEMSIAGGAWTRVDAETGTGSDYNTRNSLRWYNRDVSSFNGPMDAPCWASNSNEYASNTGNWIQSATSLTGAAGQSDVRLRFRFQSDGSGMYEGWAIDDIEVFTVPAPTVQATAVTVTALTNTTATVSWTNGNGSRRVVVARPTSAAAADPAHNNLYVADAAFGSGDATGTDNFVVYNGTGSTVTVTDLELATNYTFTVYEFSGQDMFVSYTLPGASNAGTTLPVTLLSLKATKRSGDVVVSWTTASETNNKGFEIERSADGITFTYAGYVEGALNSNTRLNYSFTDAEAFVRASSNVLYYRLKQLDADGKTDYSGTVKVNSKTEVAGTVSAYPNPFSDAYQLLLNTTGESSAIITMTDLQGRIVSSQTVALTTGQNVVASGDLQDLQAGVYFVKVTINDETRVLKVVKH
jgi:hypothetical protein